MPGKDRHFLGCIALTGFLAVASQAHASEFSVLAGIQFNDDFVVADDITTDPPAGTPGLPGTPIGVSNDTSFALALDLSVLPDPTDRIGVYYARHTTNIGREAGLADRGLDVSHLHFTAAKHYPTGRWSHFVLAGVGASFFAPDDGSLDDATEFSMQLGAGTQLQVTDRFLLRFDARWLPVITGGSAAGICSGGCVIALDGDVYQQAQINAGFSFRF